MNQIRALFFKCYLAKKKQFWMHKSVDKNVEIGLRCYCYQVYIEWRLYEKDKLFFNRKCFKIKIVKLYETIGIKMASMRLYVLVWRLIRAIQIVRETLGGHRLTHGEVRGSTKILLDIFIFHFQRKYYPHNVLNINCSFL